jgi:hypothetical protein
MELDMPNIQPGEGGCLYTEYAPEGAGWLSLCPFFPGSNYTQLIWLRSAGDAVYHSANYTAVWDADGTQLFESYHVVNAPQTEPRTPEAWASTVRVDVIVQDDGATYHSAATVTLEPFETVIDYGGGCEQADVGWAFISRCWEQRLSRIGVMGSGPLQAVY